MCSLRITALCLLLILESAVNAFNSRTVVRSTESGAVNLVEFSAKGRLLGRCSYRHNGEFITLAYQEDAHELKAMASNPTVVDPNSKVAFCRELAVKSPQNTKESRSDFGEATQESEIEIYTRLKEYEAFLAANQEQLKDLDPKFIGALFAGFMNLAKLGGYGIQFGSGSTPLFPGLNFGSSNSGSGSIFKWFGK